MAKIVGIGANVCDTLYLIDKYPDEDTKFCAESIALRGGGPCATGLVTASKLGEKCAFLGNLTDDNAGKFLKEDFEKFGVSTEFINVKKGYTSFNSCIWLSKENATRTCVYNRGSVPKLEMTENQKNAIKNAEILMVDGNELEAAVEGAKVAKESGCKVLYDAGGVYCGIEKLLALTDILIPSEEFALGHTGEKTAEDAAKKLIKMYNPEVVVITRGKNGGIIYDGKEIKTYNAFAVNAVDTNGAGDVFHGAFAFSLTKGYDFYKASVFSSAVSALKCKGIGARESVPEFNETIKFLKERGVSEFKENMD